jgi:Fe2+ transport system protein B
MMDQPTPKWPALLFTLTVLCAIASTAATFYYYKSTTLLQNQEEALSQKRTQYQDEVEELKKRVTTTKIISHTIPTPVTTMRRHCIKILGINDVCTDVPESRIEQREIQTTVTAEDPEVKIKLDAKLKELEDLSAKAVNTQQKQVSVKELVDALRGIVSPVVSMLVSLASIFIILSKKYKAESEKWAYGSLGTILGFWLK